MTPRDTPNPQYTARSRPGAAAAIIII